MARIKLATIPEEVDRKLPENTPDGSRIGVNYVDAFARCLNVKLPDGRAVSLKRKGLALTLAIGDQSATALMDRLAGRDDARVILDNALRDLARQLGYEYEHEFKKRQISLIRK
ncbi:MAG: hypothetical protein M1457_09620 [bacterium]|nr:hypothetical protein [bacterium]